MLKMLLAASLVFLLPALSLAGEYISKLHPYISVDQIYDDNIDLTSDHRRSDNITVVRPGVRFDNLDVRGGVLLNYNLGINQYWKETDQNYISHNANLDARYMTREHFNFYFRNIFIRSDEPRESEYLAPPTVPNAYVLSTTRERSVYWRNIAIPSVEYVFKKESKIGLSYTENDYKNEDPTIGREREAKISPNFVYWLDPKNGISGEYGYTHGTFDNNPDLRGHNASVRYTHRYNPRTSAYFDTLVLRRSFSDNSDYDVYNPRIGMTHAFTPTLSGQAEAGYYWYNPKTGSQDSAPTYLLSLTNTQPRTIYNVTLQGGYYEDYFTSENLGFAKFHRLLLSATHHLQRRLFVGFTGNVEYAEYTSDREDWTYGGSVRVGYDILKWLSASLQYTRQDRDSTLSSEEYRDNKVMFTISATYN